MLRLATRVAYLLNSKIEVERLVDCRMVLKAETTTWFTKEYHKFSVLVYYGRGGIKP